jgi:hypothetical protein
MEHELQIRKSDWARKIGMPWTQDHFDEDIYYIVCEKCATNIMMLYQIHKNTLVLKLLNITNSLSY